MPYSPDNTFATLDDLSMRLSEHGLTWAVDVLSYDNDIDSKEIKYAESAIEWANTKMDAVLATLGFPCGQRPANEWCRHVVVDLAAHRVMSIGGRDVPPEIRDAYDNAKEYLQMAKDKVFVIPCLVYPSITTNTGRQSFNMPFSINPCGGPRPCRRTLH